MSENRYVPVGKIKIRETIKKHLDKRGYHYAYYNDLDMFSCEMGIGGRIPKYNLSLSVHEDRFVVWADIPISIEDEEIKEVRKYLQRFWRCWFFGFKNNRVRYLKSVYCGDMLPEDKVLKEYIMSASMDVEEIIGGIIDIVYEGFTADEARSNGHIGKIRNIALNNAGIEGAYRLADCWFGNGTKIDSVILEYIKKNYESYRMDYNKNLGHIYYVNHDFGADFGELEMKMFPQGGAYSVSVYLPKRFKETDEFLKCLCELNYEGEAKFSLHKTGWLWCKILVDVFGSNANISDGFISATVDILKKTILDNYKRIYNTGETI